jgi:hypothetical protein
MRTAFCVSKVILLNINILINTWLLLIGVTRYTMSMKPDQSKGILNVGQSTIKNTFVSHTRVTMFSIHMLALVFSLKYAGKMIYKFIYTEQ